MERMKMENHDRKTFRDLKIVEPHGKPTIFILFMVDVVALMKYLPQILWLNILLNHASIAYIEI